MLQGDAQIAAATVGVQVFADSGAVNLLYLRATRQTQHRRSHENLESHHGRDGVAGQAEERLALYLAPGERLARSHVDTPEVEFAQLFQHVAHHIVGANRDAGRADEQVGLQLQRFAEERAHGVLAVARDGQAQRRCA